MDDPLSTATALNTPMFSWATRASRAKVVRVIDGDTVHVAMHLPGDAGPTKHIVRLGGIDAPELHGPNRDLAATARDALAKLVLDRIVTIDIRPKPDKYGRMLADLKLEDGTNVNDYMMQHGLASMYDGRGRKFDP